MISLLLALWACQVPASSGFPQAAGSTGVTPCAAPVSGFDRLTPSAAARGVDGPATDPLDEETYECQQLPGLVATDLDGDDDIDLLFLDRTGFPAIYENQGDGTFRSHTIDLDVASRWGRRVLAVAAADLDGDQLPEVLLSGPGLVLVSPNLGGLAFGDYDVVFEQEGYPRTCINTMALGDIDGDQDLDLALPGLDRATSASFQPPPDGDTRSPDLLLLNEDGRFTRKRSLLRGEKEGLSILGVFTDRDADGDLDLWITTDRPIASQPPAGFFRNDGLDADGDPVLVNDAAEVDMASYVSGMGLASYDMNGDGTMDYCTGDIGPLVRCFLSDGNGAWYEAGQSLGLYSQVLPDLVDHPDDTALWSTWSVEAPDLDNDGDVDLVALGGQPPDYGSVHHGELTLPQPDAVWERVDGAFVERTHGFAGGAFAEPVDNHASAMADLDRDGHLELIVHGHHRIPEIWDNPCSDNAWVGIDLHGAGDNAEGFGARVEVEAEGRVQVQELHSLRTTSQGPSELHFGLGAAARIDRVTVSWSDGAVTEALDLEPRQRLVLDHPDR